MGAQDTPGAQGQVGGTAPCPQPGGMKHICLLGDQSQYGVEAEGGDGMSPLQRGFAGVQPGHVPARMGIIWS